MIKFVAGLATGMGLVGISYLGYRQWFESTFRPNYQEAEVMLQKTIQMANEFRVEYDDETQPEQCLLQVAVWRRTHSQAIDMEYLKVNGVGHAYVKVRLNGKTTTVGVTQESMDQAKKGEVIDLTPYHFVEKWNTWSTCTPRESLDSI